MLSRLAIASMFVSLAAAQGREGASQPMQQSLQQELASSKEKLAALKKKQAEAVAAERRKVSATRNGAALLKQYEVLLQARYVDEDGVFQPEAPLSNRDITNVNALFRYYACGTPLGDAVSARQARRILLSQVKDLEERAGAQDSPTAQNNSQLQIYDHESRTAEARLEQALEVAGKIGLEPDAKGTLRQPASSK